MKETDNNLWIIQLFKGDEYAFKILFDEYYDLLNNFAFKYVEDTQVAEDIVQDIFYLVWERKEKFNNISDLKSYLYTSVKNKCINHIKHLEVVENYMNSSEIKYTSVFFLNQVLEEEVYSLLRDALKLLPENTKNVYELSLKGYDNSQIAEELGLSLDSVKSHKKRGKKLLKERLQNLVYLLTLIN